MAKLGSGQMADAESSEASPLHRRILTDITDRIVSGAWPPGHRIPFEHELSATYGCSRMTVNKALSQLAKAGLIERRRRSGSFVRQPRSQAAVLEIHDIRVEVEALGLPYRFECRARVERAATTADRGRLRTAGPLRVMEVEGLHFAGDRPFCHESRLISLAAVPEAADQPFSDSAPGPWLVARIPWSAAEHRIRAAAAAGRAARALDVAAGTACLVVERQTWSSDLPVTQVVFTYPGDRHMLVASFTPQQG
ncbi:MAG: histidine utilization repressor [Rhizobiaceae bacterium]|nr:histidine utilization repressor [Rhizobiaceae bacterium]